MTCSVFLTGASGFIGSAVYKTLAGMDSFAVTAVSRTQALSSIGAGCVIKGDPLDAKTDWQSHLKGVDVVIHCASRAHVMDDVQADLLDEYRKSNVEGTIHLARQAVSAGVRRFIFISSIKVNGEGTTPGKPYRTDDVPAPVGAFGIAKLEAEQALLELAVQSSIEVVIIRPVMVYGPGAKGNFLSMMKWLDRGIPLPFASIANSRSLVAIDNLVSLIVTCVDHPAAENQVFLVSDDEDLSTPMLLRRMARALNRPVLLVPLGEGWLKWLLGMLGKSSIAKRLFGSLQVDISKTRTLLGWTPVVGVDDALEAAVRYYQEESRK
ncbi:UDP-glucose 4-epimerase family protein [Pseudomonas japonica]|uniref:UDP-glucose 4-epimerase family protein n=1 Tax=Pseudomonas japonica TaxID=256466 RepID=UPI0037FD6AC3